MPLTLTPEDIQHLASFGLSVEKYQDDLDRIRRGFPFLRLDRPCTAGDGVRVLPPHEFDRLQRLHQQAAEGGRVTKFVPASGAATRMFQRLAAKDASLEDAAVTEFITGIRRFAFYDVLASCMARDGANLMRCLESRRVADILRYVVSPRGLGYGDLPKALIPFHRYGTGHRTALEEHLVEAFAYACDRHGRARIHVTISPEHEALVTRHVADVRPHYESGGRALDFSYSFQKTSTHTPAVDHDDLPLRGADGRLVLRPAGHGALLENLAALNGDIVFIKNIDNVVPDRLRDTTVTYKKLLGGYLIDLQNRIFQLQRSLGGHEWRSTLAFVRDELGVPAPEDFDRRDDPSKKAWLIGVLHRPLRVCGMVRNQGEPGGGPFWVEKGGVQIVEKSQVDWNASDQRKIFEAATHFNPVDIVCGLRDVDGRPFDLKHFVDPDTGFLSIKSKDGQEIKALELPGLWNGAMADWNTVFVELPLLTFNPVKTVNDLLRQEHQPESD